MAELVVKTTPVFKALSEAHERIVILEGSARSSKTYSIIQYLIFKALEFAKENPNGSQRILVSRQRLTWLKNSVLVDFIDILRNQFKMYDESCHNKTENYYKLLNTTFVFTGLDYESGQKFHGAKYDYAWFNEANEIDYPSFKQVLLRLNHRIILDYNPNMDDMHWIVQKLHKRDDVRIIHSTYKDNPFLPKAVVEEIERLKPTPENIARGTADETAWKIYGLGIRAQIKGLVFPNVNYVKEFPECEYVRYGLDFGFTNDPTALVKVGIKEGNLYIKEMLYERGLTNIDNPKNPGQMSIERRLIELGIRNKDVIIADSSEPKSIADLCGCGFDVRPAKKGANSILNGIEAIKRYRINVTEDSMNLKSELCRYKWAEDKMGNSLNIPVDGYNHAIDAMRYAVSSMSVDFQYSGFKSESVKLKFNFKKYGF